MLPFTREQFIAVFADYNGAVWPAQVVAYGLGIGIVVATLWPSPAGSRFISAALAVMWVWTGVVYHGLFFSTINKAALGFGALFVAQGALFAYVGLLRGRLQLGSPTGSLAWLGWGLVLYSGVLYPLLGTWAGHAYTEIPMFGITPCPVTLFTFGILLLTSVPVPRSLVVIPVVWSLVGGSAAFLLGIPQDWPLLFSSISAVMLILHDRQRWTAVRPKPTAGKRAR